jgi:hypothetical protein
MFWLLGLTFALENVDYFNANAVVERFNEVVSIVQYHALPVLAVAPHAYLPVTVAFCVTALFIFHLVHSTALAYRRSGPANAILVVAFSAGLLLTPFFLLFANTSAIFSARSLFAYSAIHGLWAATLLDHYGARPFSDRAARLAAIVALSMSALVVISSAAQISKRAYEEYLVSQSDLMITNRIISRIETLLAETPGAPASPIPIAVVFERHVVGGPIGGLGSARSFPWSREWIFRLLDRRFEWVTGERYIGAREAAMTHGDWPAKDSVFLHEGIVVVVINKQ